MDGFRSFLRKPLFQISPVIAGAAASVVLIGFWAGIHLLQGKVTAQLENSERMRLAQEALESDNRALREQVARYTGLEEQAVRGWEEIERMRKENERLAQKAAAKPGALLGLNDGRGILLRDAQGRIQRADPVLLPPAVARAVQDLRIAAPSILAKLKAGKPAPASAFALLEPRGTVTLSDRPAFRWKPLPGASGYVVTIFDEQNAEIARSEPTITTEWTPLSPLPRGQTCRWEVTALKSGVAAQKSPAARFHVLEPEKAMELETARQAYANSPLTLGVLFAGAGLLDDSERALQALVAANPQNPLPKRLLENVRALRK